MDDLRFSGFSKLYKGDGSLVGNCVVMSYSEKPCNSFYYKNYYDFYICKTGKKIHKMETHAETKVNKADCGIEYIASYKDDLGQLYYLSQITKKIEIEF